MRFAIYSPYLDTFGGGEKYMLTIAEALSIKGDVDLLFDHNLYSLGPGQLKDRLAKRFDLDLSKVHTVKAPLGQGSNTLERALFLKRYDILFYLTDGSIFFPTAKRNILHIQSPLVGQPSKNLWGKFKLSGWDLIIYNSFFTKKFSEKNWPIKSEVIYPPVDIDKIKLLKKKDCILSVGRFFGYLRDKKYEVIIKVFKELSRNKIMKNWSLNLVGSAGKGDENYLKELENLAKGLPINFFPNLSYDRLVKLYGESSLYWHAAGFKEEDPTKMEHFGITAVEAMAGGCIPIVINKGGLPETVKNNESGFLWNDLKQLKKITLLLIEDNELRKKMMIRVKNKSKNFSKDKFNEKIFKLIE